MMTNRHQKCQSGEIDAANPHPLAQAALCALSGGTCEVLGASIEFGGFLFEGLYDLAKGSNGIQQGDRRNGIQPEYPACIP